MLLAALAACGGPCLRAATSPRNLVAEVKAGLAERERAVVSYRFRGVMRTPDGREARYAVVHRAPNRFRVDFEGESGRSIACDGRRLIEIDPSHRVAEVTPLDRLPPAQAAETVHRTFAAYVPEGWRTPLLGGDLSARPGPMHAGRTTVEVVASVRAEGTEARVAYRFALPGFDLVYKAADAAGASGELVVTAEHCEPALGLCFPRAVEQRSGGASTARAELTEMAVNAPVPPETFELAAPIERAAGIPAERPAPR